MGIRPVKNCDGVLTWLSVYRRCRFAYDPADPSATRCLLFQKIQIGFGFTFLLPAHLHSPGQNPESRKMVIVVVVVVVVVLASTKSVFPFMWYNLTLFARSQHGYCY